jgi:hypothetical protein
VNTGTLDDWFTFQCHANFPFLIHHFTPYKSFINFGEYT